MTAASERTEHGDLEARDEREAWSLWARDREEAVAGPVGNLALVAFQSVGPAPAAVDGMPAEVWRVGDEAGVRVRPTGEGLELALDDPSDWRPVTGETLVPRLGSTGVPLLRAGERTADAFSLDGSDYELRLYDGRSEKLGAFAGIDRYEYDPAWRLTGRLEAYAETAQVPWAFTRSTDTGHTKTVPGTVAVEIDGVPAAFTAFADGGHLVLVFADGTTGRESYAPGRFLRFAPPASGEGEVELDFNRAFIPPCGFSDFYSCPIPPAENRVSAPIRAGERRVRWRE